MNMAKAAWEQHITSIISLPRRQDGREWLL